MFPYFHQGCLLSSALLSSACCRADPGAYHRVFSGHPHPKNMHSSLQVKGGSGDQQGQPKANQMPASGGDKSRHSFCVNGVESP